MASKSQTAGAAALSAILGAGGATQVAQQEIDAANARTDEVQAIVAQVDVHHPTIKSYIRHAAETGITDVLETRLIPDRAAQMQLLAEDIKADITPGENVPLNGLLQRLAEKVRVDDPKWLDWYSTNFAVHLQAQIKIGLAVGNLQPEQLVRLQDVVDVMDSMYSLYVTPHNPAAEAQWQETLKTLEEVAQEESARIEKRMAQ